MTTAFRWVRGGKRCGNGRRRRLLRKQEAAFDSRTGKNLWHHGKQYLLVPSGSTLVAFALMQ